MYRARPFVARALACLSAVSLLAVYGCSSQGNQVNAASPNNAPYGSVPPPQQQHTGLTRGQKVAILAGTAALIYLYNKHKHAQGAGPQGQYYRSRNGRIYYRDARGNAIWVTPPPQGIQVPANEAQTYERAAQQGSWDVDTQGGNYGNGGNGAYAPSGPSGPAGPGGGY